MSDDNMSLEEQRDYLINEEQFSPFSEPVRRIGEEIDRQNKELCECLRAEYPRESEFAGSFANDMWLIPILYLIITLIVSIVRYSVLDKGSIVLFILLIISGPFLFSLRDRMNGIALSLGMVEPYSEFLWEKVWGLQLDYYPK